MESKYIIEATRYGENPYKIRYFIGYYIDKKSNEKVFMDRLRNYTIFDDNFEYTYTLDEAKRIMKKHNRYNKRKCNKWYQSSKVFLRKVSKMRKAN